MITDSRSMIMFSLAAFLSVLLMFLIQPLGEITINKCNQKIEQVHFGEVRECLKRIGWEYHQETNRCESVSVSCRHHAPFYTLSQCLNECESHYPTYDIRPVQQNIIVQDTLASISFYVIAPDEEYSHLHIQYSGKLGEQDINEFIGKGSSVVEKDTPTALMITLPSPINEGTYDILVELTDQDTSEVRTSTMLLLEVR